MANIPLEIPGSISLTNPYATDYRYGPYTSVSEAIANVNIGVRYKGLTVGVLISATVSDYWWKDNTTDGALILKTSDSGGGGTVETESEITTIGTFNNLSDTAKLIRFTGNGQVVLTGFAATDIAVQEKIIVNLTGQDLNLLHNSNASSAGNRIYIPGEANSLLSNKCAVRLVNSQLQNQWIIVDWFGDGYIPVLRGEGTRTVEVLPNGKVLAVETIESKIWREDITTIQTDEQLNLEFPDISKGVQIICPLTIGGGIIYEKWNDISNLWLRYYNTTSILQTEIITYTSNSSYIIPASVLISCIIIVPTTNTSLTIGSAINQDDILFGTNLVANIATVLDIKLYSETQKTIYISGINASTKFKFIKIYT